AAGCEAPQSSIESTTANKQPMIDRNMERAYSSLIIHPMPRKYSLHSEMKLCGSCKGRLVAGGHCAPAADRGWMTGKPEVTFSRFQADSDDVVQKTGSGRLHERIAKGNREADILSETDPIGRHGR
ncbi:MAG: hypothetical protein WAM48_20865, partial [Candidatus Sulfotelmatobacter sp.]